jgi:hypothetical protein
VPKSQDSAVPSEEKASEVASAAEEAKTLSLDNEDANKAAITAVATSVAPARQASPVPARPPLAARRGGRFMDVVHPSSDMKKATPVRPAVSREGAMVQPSSSSALAEPTDVPSVSVAPDKNEEPTSAQDTSHPASASEWPDPLEMVDFKEKKEQESEPVEPTSVVTEAPKEQPPLSSPFLPDTKVEKRPLGGSTNEPSAQPERSSALSEQATDEASAEHDPDDQLPALPKDVEPILPAELHSDLMAIESDNGAVHETKPEQPDIKAPEPASPPQIQVTRDETPSGPTSIPQQYREEPSTGDQENGAIYDTDTYHQPLAHPAKKKSGWLWVVWIVLILLIGAGGGAALFFLGVI